MSIFAAPRFLPRVMAADAASCAATGAVQLAATAPLAAATGLPAPLLAATGVFLLVYALAAAAIARRRPAPRTLVGVVVGNFAWAAGCVALLLADTLPLTGWGVAWLLAQAAVVVVLAELQWTGLRRSRPVARAAGPLAA